MTLPNLVDRVPCLHFPLYIFILFQESILICTAVSVSHNQRLRILTPGVELDLQAAGLRDKGAPSPILGLGPKAATGEYLNPYARPNILNQDLFSFLTSFHIRMLSQRRNCIIVSLVPVEIRRCQTNLITQTPFPPLI